jgi:hypothetical protein
MTGRRISNTYCIGSSVALLLSCYSLFGSDVLACSGLDAADTVNNNFQRAVVLAILAGAMALAGGFIYLKARCKLSLWPLVGSTLLFALHPAWTVSAMIGDCGRSKLVAAVLFTLGIFLLFVVHMGIYLSKGRIAASGSEDVKEA